MVTKVIKRLFDSFNFFVAPSICVVCKKVIDITSEESEHLCKDCLENLPKPLKPRLVLERIDLHFGKENNPYIFAFSLYNSELNHQLLEIVHWLKYSKFKKFGYFLGTKLGHLIKEYLDYASMNYHCILPVPIHSARKRERGFNQSEIIGSAISSVTGIPMNRNILIRKIYTKTQTNLNLNERIHNLENAFVVANTKEVAGKNFILVDDVITTGSTLFHCGKVLKENGANVLSLAVLTTA
ncbi:MAG: ComF family protein [Ignavibacteria bacterium]|nr:ComF family protein [Ignavibacteria bacterium]